MLDHFVPADYVARQQELRDKKRRQQQWLAMFNRIAADYEKKFPNDKATIKQADEERIRLENQMRGGSDCKTYFDYGSLDDLKDGLRLLNNMPGGYILHMLKDGRGHAIAFEILLGKEKGEGHPKNTSYPGFCQFLDPNTGWFAFEKFNGLYAFLTAATPLFYKSKAYEYYKLYVYGGEW